MLEKRAPEVERNYDFHHAARTEIAADTSVLFLSSRIFCIGNSYSLNEVIAQKLKPAKFGALRQKIDTEFQLSFAKQ